MKDVKKLFKNLKHKLLGGGLLLLLCNVSLLGVGFSSWVITLDEATYSNDYSFNVGDNITSADKIGIQINKNISKEEFMGSTDESVSNSGVIDKLYTKLTYLNNGKNSLYPNKLNDYFDVYDPRFPSSEESPYVYNGNTGQKLYQENFYESDDYIEGNMFYSSCYDIIDKNNKTFDETEIQSHLNIISDLLDPQNGSEVSLQELIPTVESGADVSFIKIYASRVKISDTSYQFRYHFFYHVTDSNKIIRADSNLTTSPTDTAATEDFPAITLKNINANASDNLDKTFSNLNTNKRTITQLKHSRSFNGTVKQDVTFSLNSTYYNNTAGNDPNYEVIDMFKTKSDFNNYKSEMLSYIQNLSFNSNVNENGAMVEIVSEDDEENLKHTNMPWFYVYSSRYKVNSYYKKYHYYFFYFSKLDGKLHLIRDKTENGQLNGNYTSSEWPVFEIMSNNMQVHTLGEVNTSVNYRSSIIPSRYGRYYFRYAINYITNSGSYNKSLTYATCYLGSDYNDIVDTTKTSNDFNGDALIKYLTDNNSYYKNLGTDIVENISYTDERFPYLYFVLSRRKTTADKYYYYYVNLFYYTYGNNSANNMLIRFSQARFVTSTSTATSNQEWFKIDIHSTDTSTYPSKIMDKHDGGSSVLYFDLSYYNSSNALTKSLNQNISFFSNLFGNYSRDKNFDLINNNHCNDIYNVTNVYSLYNNIDYNKKNIFNAYLGSDSIWHFNGIYYRENSSRVKFDSAYSFNSSLYGFEEYSAASTSTSLPNKVITSSVMDRSYYLKETKLLKFSNKESPIIEYVFTNNSEIKKYYLALPSIGTKTKFFVKNVFDKITNDDFDFTYNITLRPKNEDVKRNYKEILKCFDFDLSISMKQEQVIR